MRTLDAGYAKFIELMEGCEEKRSDGLIYPYKDNAGIPTIGIGTTILKDGSRVTMNTPPITYAQAVDLCLWASNDFAHTVDHLVTSNINQNQFNALVSFQYNTGSLGSSTLLKKVNANPNDPDIAYWFSVWCNISVDGRLVPSEGLKNRRAKETKLYFTPV